MLTNLFLQGFLWERQCTNIRRETQNHGLWHHLHWQLQVSGISLINMRYLLWFFRNFNLLLPMSIPIPGDPLIYYAVALVRNWHLEVIMPLSSAIWAHLHWYGNCTVCNFIIKCNSVLTWYQTQKMAWSIPLRAVSSNRKLKSEQHSYTLTFPSHVRRITYGSCTYCDTQSFILN